MAIKNDPNVSHEVSYPVLHFFLAVIPLVNGVNNIYVFNNGNLNVFNIFGSHRKNASNSFNMRRVENQKKLA